MELVLEVDWTTFVSSSLSNASHILAATAVVTVTTAAGVIYVRRVDWDSLANIFINVKKMRNNYSNFLDKVENRIPDEGEQPRPEISLETVENYENIRDQGYSSLENGDAMLREFNWGWIIDNSYVPTSEEAVVILKEISENYLLLL